MVLIGYSLDLHRADVISRDWSTAWTVAIFRDRKHRVDNHDLSRSGALCKHIATTRSPSEGHDLHLTLATRGLLWNVRSPLSCELHRMARMTRGRTPQSQSDRTAIAARSSGDRGSFVVESPPRSLNGNYWRMEITIYSRSWPDRGAIVARSRRNRGPIVVLLEAKLKRICHGIEATINAKGIHPHDASIPLPRPRQLLTIIGLIFPLKSHVFYLCSSIFDRFVK